MPIHRSKEKDGPGRSVFGALIDRHLEFAFFDKDHFFVGVLMGFVGAFAAAKRGGVAFHPGEGARRRVEVVAAFAGLRRRGRYLRPVEDS